MDLWSAMLARETFTRRVSRRFESNTEYYAEIETEFSG